jgi:hypothetical protein
VPAVLFAAAALVACAFAAGIQLSVECAGNATAFLAGGVACSNASLVLTNASEAGACVGAPRRRRPSL